MPVVLDARNTAPSGPVAALERYEGMRVSISMLDIVGPSTGVIDTTAGAFRDTGQFVGVARGIARPFREPGANLLDAEAAPGPTFDGNPERLRVNSAAQRGARAVTTDVGDTLSGLVGVLGYANGAYQILPDPDAPLAIALGARPRKVATAAPGQATIATFALNHWLDNASTGADPAAHDSAYATRLAKTANAICAFLGAPDILAVTGLQSQARLAELAQAVNSMDGNLLFPGSCPHNPGYEAYQLRGGNATATGIGFLVRRAPTRDGAPRVEISSISQAGASAVLRQPDGTTQALNAHSPLLLDAIIKGDDGRRLAVTVVATALSALDEDPDAPGSHGWRTRGEGTRARRLSQATFLGQLVRERQRARPDEKLVVLGDFEASEFSDGRADLLGLIAGGSSSHRARGRDPGRNLHSLSNLVTRLPAGERYTVVRDGNAQAVDHVLVNAALLAASPDASLAIPRIDADFGEDNANDPAVPMRVSDHDPVVLYLSLGD